jgi:hypothetical protein
LKLKYKDISCSGLLQETEDVSEVYFVVLRVIKSVLDDLFNRIVLRLVRMHVRSFKLILDLVLLPVEETLQVSQCVVSYTLIELSLDFTLTSSIDTLVVDGKLSGFSVTSRLHAD